MHQYSCFDSETPETFRDFESFAAKILQTSAKKATDSNPSEKCSICSERPVDVSCLVRSCKCSSHPCERHECRCGTKGAAYAGCSHCLAQLLWKVTNEEMKKQGRYRAKCPFCKAEFCHQDIVLIRARNR
eukprot:TRINITY_DN28946_c0_g1_i1.p1 TRINITY_DN28946_c0_g1~~TRINITY_DN28946_c0_g1_i1.p1  ORF type:complete len:130 (-),score=4.63 TRINITY_DN28946_c0_g1_i1:179-568(-)